jgi:2-haloacid dehalogenase
MAALPNRDDLTAPLRTPPIKIPVSTTPVKLPSAVTMALNSPVPRALLFDVFGTCVDWRTTVVAELEAESHVSLNDATASLASALRVRTSAMSTDNWGMFAQQWRESYQTFTRRLAEDPTIPWKTVDDHHLESLKELVTE